MFRVGSRVVMLLFASLVVLGSLSMPMGAVAQERSEAAHLCQNDDYLNFTDVDGNGFNNMGQCVGYAAQGGTLTRIPPSLTVSFVPSMDNNYTCTPVAHLAYFEANTTYTVQQYIVSGPYTYYYPSW